MTEEKPPIPEHFPTDDQIKDCAFQWKKALGFDPYRLMADRDFMAGATWMRDLLHNTKEVKK